MFFPNSKVLHCFRNPKDNCLSLYKNTFASDMMNWTNKAEDIAQYYNLYNMDNFNLHMNISNNITNSSNSNFKFDYFNNCNNNTTLLGSDYPLKDNCDIKKMNIKSITSESSKCNSLWNNTSKK